ncbi:E3 ubiquitin-protein ligase KCMF1 [Drosophila nasuta]|uniref:E3 ubiquitin-protein ligase KCMF1 n=1 Tax=Drosophila nasuta TaxID=42062 RepID=UPI00295F4C8E|nr:E3 ubiquitin-protein ligase KCMF1 [Drosophila nasuta]
MGTSWNVTCDGCELINMIHHRYKCLRCDNYDLCSLCFENKVETDAHRNTHPFQCLLDREAREMYFVGERMPEMSADSFTCPFCGKMGHSARELVKHVQSQHRGDSTLVICPLCAAMPSPQTMRMSNLVNHVSLMHGTIRVAGGGIGGGIGIGGGGVADWAAGRASTGGFSFSTMAQHHHHHHHQSHSYSHSHSRGHPRQHVYARAQASASPRYYPRVSSELDIVDLDELLSET